MKKIKWSILSLAIIFSITAAFATRPHWDCSNMTQYYLLNGNYYPAGTDNVDYICTTGTGWCTYYSLDGIHYYGCYQGTFDNCVGCAIKNPTKKIQPKATSNH